MAQDDRSRSCDADGYSVLHESALPSVLARIPGVAKLLGGAAGCWSVTPLSGGNLNQLFAVRGPDGAVCTKQSLPYMRLLGEGTPMPLSRIVFEQRTMAEHARHAPERVPKVYYFDRKLHLVVMEFLAPHVSLRQGLIGAQCYPHLAAHLGDYLANIIFRTSDLALPAAARRARAAAMADNSGMYKFMEDLAYTEPYMLHPRNAWNAPHLDAMAAQVRNDIALKAAVGRLKRRYMTAAEALVHGDLHTDSILVTAADTRIIDMELSMYGPMGYDFGHLFGHLFLNYFAQNGLDDPYGKRRAQQDWTARLIEQIWDFFSQAFRRLWFSARSGDAYPADWFDSDASPAAQETALSGLLADILADGLGFAGIEMIRRILNLGQVADLELIAEPARRAVCERRALRLARSLVVDAPRFADVAAATRAAARLRGPA